MLAAMLARIMANRNHRKIGEIRGAFCCFVSIYYSPCANLTRLSAVDVVDIQVIEMNLWLGADILEQPAQQVHEGPPEKADKS